VKVSCNHCGAQNDLGRMFCMACGKRMTITREDVAQARETERAFRPGVVLRPLLLLAVLGLILAALWPQTPFDVALPEAQRPVAVARAVSRVNGLSLAARGKRSVKAAFSADELGLYLAQRDGGPKGEPPLTVRLDRGRVTVRRQGMVGPVTLGARTVGPFRYSLDVDLVPQDRGVVLRGGRFGHLPLPGPLAIPIRDALQRAFPLNAAEREIEKQMTELVIRGDTLELVLGP